MGQGAESCGGYEVDYDPYEDNMPGGLWVMRDGRTISVDKMSDRHIRNSIRLCRQLAECATFSSEADKWSDWERLLEEELYCRMAKKGDSKMKSSAVKVCQKAESVSVEKEVKKAAPQRGAETLMICHCGKEYVAKNTALRRGWGLSCNKSCAKARTMNNLPAAKPKTPGDWERVFSVGKKK